MLSLQSEIFLLHDVLFTRLMVWFSLLFSLHSHRLVTITGTRENIAKAFSGIGKKIEQVYESLMNIIICVCGFTYCLRVACKLSYLLVQMLTYTEGSEPLYLLSWGGGLRRREGCVVLYTVAVNRDLVGEAKRAVTSSPIDSADLLWSRLDFRCQHHTRGTACESLAQLKENKCQLAKLSVPMQS